MQSRWLSSLLAGASLVAASVMPNENWAISSASRTKSLDKTSCTWELDVENETGNYKCNFIITAPSGTDCGAQSFSQIPCEGNEGNPLLSINGGHDNRGFIVVVLDDTAHNTTSFFGYSDADLDTASNVSNQKNLIEPQGIVKRDEIAARDCPTLGKWTIQDLTRDFNYDKHQLTIAFLIADGSPNIVRCEIKMTPPADADMPSWNWANQECGGSGFWASWGDSQNDAAVMTLVSPDRAVRAFFGFSSIKEVSSLGNSGPSDVRPSTCF